MNLCDYPDCRVCNLKRAIMEVHLALDSDVAVTVPTILACLQEVCEDDADVEFNLVEMPQETMH